MGVCGCAQVFFAGVHWCAQVFAGVQGFAMRRYAGCVCAVRVGQIFRISTGD